jgi:hypothetical protein
MEKLIKKGYDFMVIALENNINCHFKIQNLSGEYTIIFPDSNPIFI